MDFVTETDDRFYLAPSKVPHAGRGVFAKVPLKKADYLEVIGVQVPKNGLTAECTAFADHYKFAAKKLDADRYIVPLGFAGMINHAIDAVGMNCKLDYRKGGVRNPGAGQAILVFLRDIEPGEEMLHYYSDDYNGKLKWISTQHDVLSEAGDELDKFLSLNLYNLGLLKE